METKKLTFAELTEIEPGLKMLLDEAKHYPVGNKYCPITTWYRQFKPDLLTLVGWFAVKDDPIIKSSGAYDLAYKTIEHSLPTCPRGCRNCS